MTDRLFQTRALTVLTGFVGLFSLLSWRLIHVQVEEHEEWVAWRDRLHGATVKLPADRGRILDRDGHPLACNRPVFKVVADRVHLNDLRICVRGVGAAEGLDDDDVTRIYPADEVRDRYMDYVVETLAGPLGLHPWELARKLRDGTSGDAYLLTDVGSARARVLVQLIEGAGIGGVELREGADRHHPSPQRLTHVIGYVDQHGVGRAGIERAMEDVLRGADGFRVIERDNLKREIAAYRGEFQPPVDGNHVRLTVDTRLQDVVEDVLDEWGSEPGEVYVPALNAKKVSVVLLRPGTGEVLAMASRPHFDLETREGNRRNPAIYDTYEPGSTFKIVTYAGVYEHRLVAPTTPIDCEWGTLVEGGIRLVDAHGYGVLPVEKCFYKSSNIAAYKLAKQLGRNRFFGYVKAFGFGERTGIELDDEARGLVTPVERWSKPSFSRMAMGYEVSVTPLQMAAAVAAIANGGELVPPRLVIGVEDDLGNSIAHPVAVPRQARRVVSERAAGFVRDAMVKVTGEGGTGTRAALPGYRVAGKTGTAQRFDPERGYYVKGRYVVSFAGFVPAENPQLAGVVVVDDPEPGSVDGPLYGGTVAAPIFRRIIARAVNCLAIEPTHPEELEPEEMTLAGGGRAGR